MRTICPINTLSKRTVTPFYPVLGRVFHLARLGAFAFGSHVFFLGLTCTYLVYCKRYVIRIPNHIFSVVLTPDEKKPLVD